MSELPSHRPNGEGPAQGPVGPSTDWRPSAGLAALQLRAALLAKLRAFFLARGVLEVETPVLCAAGAVDAHLEPIPVFHSDPDSTPTSRYLVTSPEHSMKRLLAAGAGPIYQITRAFRRGERGRLHNPEFTILEWYRPGFDAHALMDEVEALVVALAIDAPAPSARAFAAQRPFARVTYQEAFARALRIDPHTASVRELAACAQKVGVPIPASHRYDDRDAWLELLLVFEVEKQFVSDRPTFLIDYPPSQAALARIRPGPPAVAERFELYAHGLELCNGYHELIDAREQSARFHAASAARAAAGRDPLPIDTRFLAALEHGLPACAGVAVGFDRLCMLCAGAHSIDEVIAFPVELA
ncbi:MAG: EF-P lysine aminoacylase EpmA [Planctomycetota bacterium]